MNIEFKNSDTQPINIRMNTTEYIYGKPDTTWLAAMIQRKARMEAKARHEAVIDNIKMGFYVVCVAVALAGLVFLMTL